MNFVLKMILGLVLFVNMLFAIDTNKELKEFESRIVTKFVAGMNLKMLPTRYGNQLLYVVGYSDKFNAAVVDFYMLDGSKVDKVNLRKRPNFYPDTRLDKKHMAQDDDYKHQHYDRGHLANDAAFDYSKGVLRKVYCLSNIVPQKHYINAGIWADAEKITRELAVMYKNVYVLNYMSYTKSNRYIGKHIKIKVPSVMYKIVYIKIKNKIGMDVYKEVFKIRVVQ